ncbi:MAG: glutamate ABC transporter substrate-binding protein [Solirubrobacterales bacterium]|nr:glutamate ABC transporter substrate-binding protein [Solirubrobacterales bacterium]
MTRAIRHLLGLALVALALAGCATSSDHGLRMAMRALETPTPQPPSKPPTTVNCTNPTASLRPPASMPVAGHMPSGSFMREIQDRGYLRAGINTGAFYFGYLDPTSGNIKGFEIDLVREIARAIFGDSNPNRVHLLALRVSQREDAVAKGQVDIVVDTVTITCKRKHQVDFSTVYYQANQRVLVPSNSPATDINAFNHQRVCATKNSTPYDVMKANYPQVIAYGTDQAIDCLPLLQEGRVAAISTDDAILLGFRSQDQNTKIIGGDLSPAPYGMEISKQHPPFVRFVNGVLAKLRADGTWRALFHRWLGGISDANPLLPPPQYEG